MRVFTVVGNRPQFIKSAPLSAALRDAGIDEVILHTGQHYDPELSQVFYDELGLPQPAYRLETHAASPELMLPGIREAIEREQPDWVLVYGDTNSTLAGARAAGTVAIAHVEAGLRSFDLSMPEERNRIAVDRLAALLLCPDDRSARQLAAEGVQGRSEVVGDVMADATRIFAPLARGRAPVAGDDFFVLTLHREANTEPERLRGLVAAVGETRARFVFPVHPRTRAVLDRAAIALPASIEAIGPVGYLEMLALIQTGRGIVTDSGGLQKEAYWLRRPCVTLRANTEWVDTVAAGANVLVDPEDPSALPAVLAEARFPGDAPPLYGDGHASERVAAALYASRP